MNLDTIEYVDAMKTSGSWGPAPGNSAYTLDANGWPTSDAAIVVEDLRVNQPWNGPDPNAVQPDIGGTYNLSFRGQATVSPPSWLQIFSVQNQVYNAATNTTTAQVVVGHNVEPFLDINFTNTRNTASTTDAGVSNVQLLRPGYAANTSQVFTSEFLNALVPVGTLRYLNIDGANGYPPTTDANGNLIPLNWSQRTLPSDASQTYSAVGKIGESWEYMIALANASNTDLWINIPGPASDDYVTQLANLIKNGDTVNGVSYAGLNSNLKVYVEYSNEVWGGISAPYQYNNKAAQQAVANGDTALVSDGNTGAEAGRYYLQRTMQITNLFRNVLGADAGYAKVRPVLGWQENVWQYYTQTLPWFQSNYGAPSNYFYGMGNANYVGPTDTSSVNAILTSLAAAVAQESTTTTDFTIVADFYGLKNVAYEGGPAIGGGYSQPLEGYALAASRDPRMEAIVENEYLTWFAAGGSVANFFDGPFGIWSPQNMWDIAELSEAANPSLSPKYRGLVDLANAPAQTVIVGIPVSSTTPTSLSVIADSLGQSFTSPHTSDNNFWLVNVPTAGTYDLSLTTGVNGDFSSKFNTGQVQVSLNNGTPLGTYNVSQAGNFNLGTIALPAGVNTLVIHTLRGSFDPSNTSFGYEFQFQPTSLTLTPVTQTSTVGGTGFTDSGIWTQQGAALVAPAGAKTSTASWTFNVTPGVFQVSAIWPGGSVFSPDATYTILDGSNVLATVPVNQQVASTGSTSGQNLGGTVVVLGNTLTIRISNVPDGSVAAQTVQVQQTQSLSSAQVVNDNNGYQFAITGTWSHVGDSTYIPGNSGAMLSPGATASWTFNVTPGIFKISAIWPGGSGFSPDATYTILVGSMVIATVPVNQQVASNGYNDGSVTWQDLGGPYNITGTALTIRLAGMSDGNVEAQAVRIQQVPTVSPLSPITIQAGASGFSTAGSWGLWPGYGHAGTLDEQAAPGDGSSQATWSFANLAPGYYQVSIVWPSNPNRATNAPYTIFDGTSQVGTATINQQLNPVGTPDTSGTTWQTVGTYSISSGTLKVLLTNLGINGYIEADAVKITPVAGPQGPSLPTTIQAGATGFSTVGSWGLWPGYGHAGTLDEQAAPGNGSSQATWAFTNLAAGSYQVSIVWPSNANRATNAPYTIFDGTTQVGTATINQQRNPVGTPDAYGTTWQTVGTYSISSGTLKVLLTNLGVNGYIEADAVQITPESSVPPPPPTPITIQAGASGFSTVGSWGLWPGYGHAGTLDEQAAPGDGSSQATWDFAGLASGSYQVSIVWPSNPNRATNAPYSIFDGTSLVGTATINQQLNPVGNPDTSGTVWQTLGTYSVSSGTLKVLLTNLGLNGYIEADAVKILKVS